MTFARSSTDASLNRSYDYDQVGRLVEAHTGNEADAHVAGQPFPAQPNGAYSQSSRYDVWGNMTTRVGWGGWDGGYVNWTQTYTNNRLDWVQYDAAGYMVNDGGQYSYDAAGRQTNATYPPSWNGYTLQQGYDGDGQRAKKVDNGTTTYYLRSSVLGGQVIAELNGSGQWQRGYVYMGSQLLAIQAGGVFWVAQDPVTKSQRITDAQGNLTTAIDVDPWGGETTRSSFSAFQPHRYTSYERDGNSNDQAGARTYHGFWLRFDQPDPYDGSMDLSEPQSFNRYSYVQNDPVNFVDPSGLDGYSVDDTINAARDALQNSSCRKLFGGTNPIELLNGLLRKHHIQVRNNYNKYSNARTGKPVFTHDTIPFGTEGAVTNKSGSGSLSRTRIYINAGGFMNTGQGYQGAGYGLDGLSPSAAGAVGLIHELLHAAGNKIPYDGRELKDNGAQSVANTEMVRFNCVTLPGILNAPVTTNTNGLRNLTITPRPLLPLPGRGGGFGGWTSLDLLHLMYGGGGGHVTVTVGDLTPLHYVTSVRVL